MSEKKKGNLWLQIALLVVLIVALGAALWYWHEPLWELFNNKERIQEWVDGFGPWGPLVSIGLNVAQVMAAPIPGQLIGVTNGFLYGFWLGSLYSTIGLLLGRTLAMLLGRWFGRRLLERLVDPEQLARWDRIASRQGPAFFFLALALPVFPDDLLCFVIGLSSLPIPLMIALAALGGMPGVLFPSWMGAHGTELPWWVWIPLGGGAIVLAWVIWRYQARLEAAMLRLIQRLTGKRPRTDADEETERGEDEETRGEGDKETEEGEDKGTGGGGDKETDNQNGAGTGI